MAEEAGPAKISMVYVGRKPMGVYLARAVMGLAEGHEVRIVARGVFIGKAVTVAMRTIKATGCDYDVDIGEEALSTGEQTRLVPKIEIKLRSRRP